jgi:hypothetical protein
MKDFFISYNNADLLHNDARLKEGLKSYGKPQGSIHKDQQL